MVYLNVGTQREPPFLPGFSRLRTKLLVECIGPGKEDVGQDGVAVEIKALSDRPNTLWSEGAFRVKVGHSTSGCE